MRLLLLAVLCLFAGLASAGTVTATWTMPTSNTDGSAIPATGAGSIASSRVEYGTCNGALFGVKAGESVVPAPATSTVITLGPGTYCFQARVTNTYSVESAATNAVQRIVPPPIPNPPTIVTAVVANQIDVPVFKILPDGTRSSAVAGFVTVGASCTGDPVFTYRGKTYRRVAQADVRWWGTTKTDNIAAPCAGA